MKWLSLAFIKAHSRIDYNIEDDLLELYGESAEDTIINYLNRSFDDLVGTYGDIPKPLYQAALMLVDLSYTQRGPVSPTNLYEIPYGFDALVKPYMKL